MACIAKIAPINGDSEMEEGEIVDDLSDISSEEEFLLRQRLEVLENYNNVLERKKAKRSSVGPGKKYKKEDALSHDLSEISATDLEDYCLPHKNVKVQKHLKTHHKQKRKKLVPSEVVKIKDHKKKTGRPKRKQDALKVLSETSEESDDEYRNRRRKLADAVVVNKTKNDKTSLSERLQKMFCGVNPEPMKLGLVEVSTIKDTSPDNKIGVPPNCSPISSQNTDDHILCAEIHDGTREVKTSCDIIDICTDDENKNVVALMSVDAVDSVLKENKQRNDIQNIVGKAKDSDKGSDDDLELLRQHALKTKNVKTGKIEDNKILSEDEDSDTTELRLICLKSAILKKAIEMKRKQKLQKKISKSSNLKDDTFDHVMMTEEMNSDNNTDIESVDMDIGSDGDEKLKEHGNYVKDTVGEQLEKNIPILMVSNEDEIDEDEDLLRARLLTSLSKNLPNLVTPSTIKSLENVKTTVNSMSKQPPVVIPPERRFIINVESDSEGEHEATKNLTKMHMKLSEQIDFQQKLDMFLKSTRMEVEKTKLPDGIEQRETPKKNEKFVAKAVKNLPKSEQIEYKNLVKRMAELEKMKLARQTSINLSNKKVESVKDTLKPRNGTFDSSNLSTISNVEMIKNSRKNIAEESAKMLKLKDEGTKLSQKFKIVATELRNIKTAIALNKKQQRSVQNYLAKIRLHHQMLLKSSLTPTHSKPNAIIHSNNINPKLQKENNPKDHSPMALKEISKGPMAFKEISKGPMAFKEISKGPMAFKEISKGPMALKEISKGPMALKEIPKGNYKNPAMLKTNKIGIDDLKQQKAESNPKPPPPKNPTMPKAIKSGIANDLKQQKPESKPKPTPLVIQHPRLSIEVDVSSNKKVVTMPNKDGDAVKSGVNKNSEDLLESKRLSSHPAVEKGGGTKDGTVSRTQNRRHSDDYRSPLDALGNTTWKEDPNAILCPFEVCGDCKDTDCKYLHTTSHST